MSVDFTRIEDIFGGKTFPCVDRHRVWKNLLGMKKVDGDYKDETIRRAIRACVGQFNFWEWEGEPDWDRNLSSTHWYEYLQGKRDINHFNLIPIRTHLLRQVDSMLDEMRKSLVPYEMYLRMSKWWSILNSVYGGDPLWKRETLLWMIVQDLGIIGKEVPPPRRGCIDYNIILYFRYTKIVTGYKGNRFGIIEETRLREDCLVAIEEILNRNPCLRVQDLDEYLYMAGREIRKLPKVEWEKYFCYRPGCFFY